MAEQTDHITWHRARCGSNACVEVAQVGERYLIRDSKEPTAAPLSFSAEEWTAFVRGIKEGEFPFA
ncbi:DUF397 domain-containing protein [Krasilnikovia sp. MM14-A1259]|uniref:DUF397 domain-containing protein n=1 Tax=Krasilnikovia sp. MM14-A1259 TaxID=3373539 RepID=UPI00382EAAF2